MTKRPWHGHLKHWTIPHEGNNYRPPVVATTALAAFLFLTLLLEGAYLLHKDVVFTNPDFLAAVLPSALVTLTNEDRETNGIPALMSDATLAQAAQLKANDMAEKGYFSHVTPDGKQPWHWLELVGYTYTHAGENLAVNFEDSKDVEKAWMNSPTHRANIVKPQYTHVGIAVAKGEYQGKTVTFVVQFFATPAVAAALSEPVATATPEEPSVAEAPVVTETVAVAEPEPAAVPLEPSVLAEAVASPNHAMAATFSVLALIAVLLLAIAVAAHMQAPYIEALGGTAVVLVVVVGMYTFNLFGSRVVEVPTDTNAAAVILSGS